MDLEEIQKCDVLWKCCVFSVRIDLSWQSRTRRFFPNSIRKLVAIILETVVPAAEKNSRWKGQSVHNRSRASLPEKRLSRLTSSSPAKPAHSPPYGPVTEILVNRLRYHAVTLAVTVQEPRLVARRRRFSLTDVADVEAVPRMRSATLIAHRAFHATVGRRIVNRERSVGGVVPAAAKRAMPRPWMLLRRQQRHRLIQIVANGLRMVADVRHFRTADSVPRGLDLPGSDDGPRDVIELFDTVRTAADPDQLRRHRFGPMIVAAAVGGRRDEGPRCLREDLLPAGSPWLGTRCRCC